MKYSACLWHSIQKKACYVYCFLFEACTHGRSRVLLSMHRKLLQLFFWISLQRSTCILSLEAEHALCSDLKWFVVLMIAAMQLSIHIVDIFFLCTRLSLLCFAYLIHSSVFLLWRKWIDSQAGNIVCFCIYSCFTQFNYQFDFLRPQHSLFHYFTKLVEQYTKVSFQV